MKSRILIFAAALTLLAGCNRGPKEPTRDELAQSIDSIEAPLMQAAMIEAIDTAQGNKLVALYIQFADTYPDDTLSAAYLHRAAQVANGMGLIDDMTTYYDRVIDNYPDYANLDNAGRKEEARKAYQEFLTEYPDHFLANDIQTSLSLLDMSDELLIEYLNKQNK